MPRPSKRPLESESAAGSDSLDQSQAHGSSSSESAALPEPPRMSSIEARLPADCVQKVSGLVQRSRGLQNTEVEVRFGTMENGIFKIGTDRAFIDKNILKIQSNPAIKDEDWNEHQDFYYNLVDGRTVRHRVKYDTDYIVLDASVVFKSKIAEVVLAVGDPQPAGAPKLRQRALRVVLSTETPIDASAVPQLTATQLVRIQQRRCFAHGGTREAPNWRFEFSMTWQDQTKTGAEQKQQSVDPIFEMEIEACNPNYVNTHSNEYVAKSMLLKALDFLPPNSTLDVRREWVAPNA